MSKITKVLYKELSSDQCSLSEAAQYYYFSNLSNKLDDKDYEDYEIKQMKIRNSIIRDAKNNKEINEVSLNSSILAISSVKNKVVLVSDII